MKKNRLILLLLFTLFILFRGMPVISAQDSSDTENLFEKFPRLFVRESFGYSYREYYRFPTLVPFFDPLDLKYFPHETWNQQNWSLLERWQDTWNYHQLIMLNEPAPMWIFHGTDVGRAFGFLDDFYLYGTFFVADNYPEGSGSCYVYYSDSLLKGFASSNGILVDPRSGVYTVENTYGSYYSLTNKNHVINIRSAIDPDDFPISENDIAASSYGAHDFDHKLMDRNFECDWEAIRAEPHMRQSKLHAYRLELIRENGLLRVYINGKQAAELEDGIKAGEKPGMVSWSFGPMLYNDGETVTCAVGDFYIYGRERQTDGTENETE